MQSLARDAHPSVPHYEYQETRLTLGKAEFDDGPERVPRLSSVPELLGQSTVATTASTTAAAAADAQAHPAITREARPRHAGAVSAAIVWRDDLDVLAIPAAIWLLVLDAHVGEVDLVIEVRQVVSVGPLPNLICKCDRGDRRSRRGPCRARAASADTRS
jgi:hypothetical protein